MERNQQVMTLRAEKAEENYEVLKEEVADAKVALASSPTLISDLDRQQYMQEISRLQYLVNSQRVQIEGDVAIKTAFI